MSPTSSLRIALLLILLPYIVSYLPFLKTQSQKLVLSRSQKNSLWISSSNIHSSGNAGNELQQKSDSKKLLKRWATGLSLGAIGTVWIFSGNGIFTFGFLIASLVALNEYYDMVKAAGERWEHCEKISPATKTGTLSSLVCYIAGIIYKYVFVHLVFIVHFFYR